MSAASADALEPLGQLDEVGARALDPAPDGDLVAPGVEPDGDAARDTARQSSSTSAGRSTAAVPTTTRSTPGVEQLQGRLGRAHAAAHLDLAVDAAHDQPDLLEVGAGRRCAAASRSTTWIHWAPAASNSRATRTGSSS